MQYSRREIVKLGLAALPAAELLRHPIRAGGAEAFAKPNSVFSGVQVGVIAPYSFRGLGNNPEDLLKAIVKLGLSAVELQSEAIEPWAGAPAGGRGGPPGRGRGGPGGFGPGGGPGALGGFGMNLPGLSEAQQAALRELNESLAARSQALAAARTALSQATFAATPDAADIKRKTDAVAAAELDLAQARSEAFTKLQASPNKLNDRQVEALVQQSASGGGGRGGGRGMGGGSGGGPGGPGGPGGGARNEELRKWRLSQSMGKFKELRKRYNDAGVSIGLVKFGLGPSLSDEEVDYCFQVAKAVGARGITCEPPVSETRRLGQFAEKHKLRIGYHGHSNVSSPEAFGRPGAWEQAFFYSSYNGANIDIGHFAAGNNVPATDFIKRYADRITNLHLKDRKFNEGENLPGGQGDSQVKEILQLMKRERYEFMATIELEYRIPEGSDTMTELAKCVQFCRDALA
jgi:sugar phosphate isomerase/epimerase